MGSDGVDVFWGGCWGVGFGAYLNLSKRCASAVLWGALLPVSRLLIIDSGAERALRRVLRSPQTKWCHRRARELEP